MSSKQQPTQRQLFNQELAEPGPNYIGPGQTERQRETDTETERQRERERESVFFIAQELVVIVVYLHALEESGRREKNNKHQSVTIIISYLCGIRE